MQFRVSKAQPDEKWYRNYRAGFCKGLLRRKAFYNPSASDIKLS